MGTGLDVAHKHIFGYFDFQSIGFYTKNFRNLNQGFRKIIIPDVSSR
jgi:hypothetical protein